MRRLTRIEMRTLLAIEDDLNDRRDLHLSGLDAFIRREIRQTWKSLFVSPAKSWRALRATE